MAKWFDVIVSWRGTAADALHFARVVLVAITVLFANGMQGKASRCQQRFREVIIWNHTQGFCIQFLRLVHMTVEKFCSAGVTSCGIWNIVACRDVFFFIIIIAKCIMGLLNLKINEYILFLCFLQITQMQPYVSVITFSEVSAVSEMDVFPLGVFLFVVHIFCWQTQFV